MCSLAVLQLPAGKSRLKCVTCLFVFWVGSGIHGAFWKDVNFS